MNIVCLDNATIHARHTTAVAAALAVRANDSLVVLRDPPEVADKDRPAASRSNSTLEESPAFTHPELAGTRISTASLSGRPIAAIVEHAASASTRLMVVAAPGDAEPRREKLARAAEEIAESAPVPTLIVRDAAPLMAWMRDRCTLRVFCAYDFTACADAALNVIKTLRQWGPCDVTVTHVDQPLDENVRLGLLGSARFDTNAPEVQHILERDLEERVTSILGNTGIRIHVEGALGRPDPVFLDFVNRAHADLLVVGSHQWHGWKRLTHISLSRALLRHATTNVLVVPGRPELAPKPDLALRRVLVATDFSTAGNEAVRHAFSLAGPGATVHLLHVVQQVTTPGDEFEDRISHQPDAQQGRECTERLRVLVPDEARPRGVDTQLAVVAHHDVPTAIVQAAERIGAHVICLATHRPANSSRSSGRSVVNQVLRKSHRPVLLIRPTPP